MEAFVARLRACIARPEIFAASLVAVAIASIALCALLRRDGFVPLFAADLQSEQVNEVTQTLALWNVPYAASGGMIRVDAVARKDVLLRLSMSGIPHPHVSTRSEALSKASALTPQSVLDVQQLDGLAGDIELSLRGVGGVRDARVIIAPAKPATFGDEVSHESSASVRLTLEPGTAFTREMADGVRAFVAASVPGLDAQRVAILDDRFSAGAKSPGARDEAAEQQAALQSALDAAFGAATTIVRVHADFDQQSREVHEQKRVPVGGEAIGFNTSSEEYANANKRYAKRNRSEDRGSDVRTERTDVPAGRLVRLSAAIAVDRAKGLDLAKIRSLALGTLGLDESRGDTLAIEEVDFIGARAIPAPSFVGPALLGALPAALVSLAGIALAFGLARPGAALVDAALQRAKVLRARKLTAGYSPAHVRGALKGEPPHTAAAIISALPAATASAVLELYPPEERAAIVRRMSRGASPVVPDVETVLRHA